MDNLIDVGSRPSPGERREAGLRDNKDLAPSRSVDGTGGEQDIAKNPNSENFDGHMAATTRENRETRLSNATSEPLPTLMGRPGHQTSPLISSNVATGALGSNSVNLDKVLTSTEGEALMPSDFSADELRKVLGGPSENRGAAGGLNGEAISAKIKTTVNAPAPAAGSTIITTGFLIESSLTLTESGSEAMLGKVVGSSASSAISAASPPQAALGPAPAPAVQIVAAIKKERAGSGVEVRLDPPEMGRVRIDFTMESAEAVKAVLTAERPETLEHLRRNMDDLLTQLKQAGFSAVDLEFSGEGASAFSKSPEAATHETNSTDETPQTEKDVIYLSMRDEAQLDLLV